MWTMAKKSKFGVPNIECPELPPGFLESLFISPMRWNLRPFDYKWLGEDENYDPRPFIEKVCTPVALLRAVMAAIIAGSPKETDEAKSGASAMRAVGYGSKKRTTSRAFDPMIQEMSDRYF